MMRRPPTLDAVPPVAVAALDRLALTVAALALSWGVFAVGAVYPWGFWPLAALCAAAGGLSPARPGRTPTAVACATAVVATSIALQLVPLPRVLLTRISPATEAFLQRFDVAFAVGAAHSTSHALSIAPARTVIALALLVALVVFMCGLARTLDRTGAIGLVVLAVTLGASLAIVGLAFMNVSRALVYGFWPPQDGPASTFGPFVNRNHFAGALLMLAPLTVGLLLGLLDGRAFGGARDWRTVVASLSSKRTSLIVLTALSLALMAVAMVCSTSRSGMVCFVLAMLAFVVPLQRPPFASVTRRATLFLLIVVLMSSIWAGLTVVGDRLADFSPGTLQRTRRWTDAMTVVRDFPWTGTGLNTYGIALLGYQDLQAPVYYTEAHNDYLQLAAEGGALVGVPVLVLLVLFAAEVRRRFHDPSDLQTYWIRVGAVVGLLAVGAQSLVEFSLQIPANAALFAALCAIALHRRGGSTRSGQLDAWPASRRRVADGSARLVSRT